MSDSQNRSKTSSLRKRLNREIEKRRFAKKQLKAEIQSLESEKELLQNVLQAQEIIQQTAQEVQTIAHKKIATIVTKCLAMVFENPYTFEIDFVRKRNRTEAEIYLTRDGHRLSPMESTGGGVLDVASFALRIACLSLQLPMGRRFVALDEPFKNVSVAYRRRIAAMLEMLSEELGFQFLISTHMKSLKLGTVVELEE